MATAQKGSKHKACDTNGGSSIYVHIYCICLFFGLMMFFTAHNESIRRVALSKVKPRRTSRRCKSRVLMWICVHRTMWSLETLSTLLFTNYTCEEKDIVLMHLVQIWSHRRRRNQSASEAGQHWDRYSIFYTFDEQAGHIEGVRHGQSPTVHWPQCLDTTFIMQLESSITCKPLKKDKSDTFIHNNIAII